MGDAPDAKYRPVWLTAEEHQALFGELLAAPEGFQAERVAELLKRADARAGDANIELSLGGNGLRFSATSQRALPMTPSAVARARLRLVAAMLLALVVGFAATVILRLVTRR